MASYYKKIIGTLEPGKLARSGDINDIQSSVQEMISRVIVDMFGPAYILGHEENTLKLTPTPLHIDQKNQNYDENDCWISFYERYFRQKIETTKSEISGIKIYLHNLSNLNVTIFGEIRDYNFNLVKEANVELSPTIESGPKEVEFEFNIQHLPVGVYYFVLRSVDLSRTDLIINGDEDSFDNITPDMFLVKYDSNGSYCQGLQASYNATDYLDAILLEDQFLYTDDVIGLKSQNSDLCFEQTFSKGNTYLIEPGAAIILGQKTYPVDTHVTIDGPSSVGDRTDLVTLTVDGRLNVIKGDIYNGERKYPSSNTGLQIAYITTFKTSVNDWECPHCGYINEGHIENCCKCNTLSNDKIPLIEQGDENFITRQRDVLERLRRLEKKVSYDIDRNSPSRIKYICTIDPEAEIPSFYITKGENGKLTTVEDKEGSYGYRGILDDEGNTVYVPNTNVDVKQYYYAIKDKIDKNTPLPKHIKGGDDSFYKDGVSVDVDKGVISLQKYQYNDEYSKNTPLSKLNTYESQNIKYTIKGKSNLGELNSEYAVLNFTLNRDSYIKSLTPYITTFNNIEKFGIILFRNDEVFNLTKTTRICYQKKFKDDPTFPNVYESKLVDLKDLVKTKGDLIQLKDPITFDVNKEIPAGNYSLLVYGVLKDGTKEGNIIIKEYTTLGETDTYGISTKCIGTTNPSIVYLETNNISNRSWDLVIERKNAEYFDRGTLISQAISTDQKIYSCSVSKNYKIPDGCSIQTYVSNNGGKTYVNASNGNVTFSGTGNSFRFKLVLNGNGDVSPEVLYDANKHYALLFNVGTSKDYIQWEDYQTCVETKMLDGEWITNFLLSADSVKRFSEWEFARVWMENMDSTKIDICISYDEDSIIHVRNLKTTWPKTIFFNTIIADLIESDFSTKSVDYDNYNDDGEPDEHNYRFKLEEDYQYNYSAGEIICSGANDGLGNINSDLYNMDDFYYTTEINELEYEWDNYIQNVVSSSYTNAVFALDGLEEDRYGYYTSWSDRNFDHSKVIIGKSWPNGLKISENYTNIIVDIIPTLQEGDAEYDRLTRYKTKNGELAIPAGTLELVMALNVNGAIEDENATYGKAYTINQDLINNKHNTVTIGESFGQDLYAFGEIKSIGIRVKDKPQLSTTIDGEKINYAHTLRCQNTSKGIISDSIGIGAIKLTGYNIKPLIPYETEQKRLLWKTKSTNPETGAFVQWRISRTWQNGSVNRIGNKPQGLMPYGELHGFVKLDPSDEKPSLDVNGNPNYDSDGYLLGRTLSPNDVELMYAVGTRFYNVVPNSEYKYITNQFSSSDPLSGTVPYNHPKTFNDIAREGIWGINFKMGAGDTGNLFQIDVNTDIAQYDLIRISYTVPDYWFGTIEPENGESELGWNKYLNTAIYNTTQNASKGFYPAGQFGKGDIFVDLYDTTDTDRNLPVESFPLPAWGRIQATSTSSDKICNAIFKKRSNATKIKAIVIRRDDPNNTGAPPLELYIKDMVAYNAKNLPALGPKMLMRIYPNSKSITDVPQLRKYGCVFTLQ